MSPCQEAMRAWWMCQHGLLGSVALLESTLGVTFVSSLPTPRVHFFSTTISDPLKLHFSCCWVWNRHNICDVVFSCSSNVFSGSLNFNNFCSSGTVNINSAITNSLCHWHCSYFLQEKSTSRLLPAPIAFYCPSLSVSYRYSFSFKLEIIGMIPSLFLLHLPRPYGIKGTVCINMLSTIRSMEILDVQKHCTEDRD